MKNNILNILMFGMLLFLSVEVSFANNASDSDKDKDAPKAEKLNHKEDGKGDSTANQRGDKKMTTGWFEMEPYYVMNKSEGGQEHLVGLDAELVKAIMKAADYNVEYRFIQWGDQINNLKNGDQHFAAAATETEERKNYVYFSDPYRKEENSFYVRKGDASKYSFNTRHEGILRRGEKKQG